MGSYYFDYYIYLSINKIIKMVFQNFEISNYILKELKEIKDF
jgi:hypothetical protein